MTKYMEKTRTAAKYKTNPSTNNTWENISSYYDHENKTSTAEYQSHSLQRGLDAA